LVAHKRMRLYLIKKIDGLSSTVHHRDRDRDRTSLFIELFSFLCPFFYRLKEPLFGRVVDTFQFHRKIYFFENRH
jgi:hypothetical protein